MRRAFLSRVADMIRNEPDTTFFTVDIGMWAIRDVLRDFPERCTNVGIYEDAMFSIAAGMSRRGLVPTIFGIQPYLIERALEQIKMDLAYQKLGVNVVGTGAAVDYPNGHPTFFRVSDHPNKNYDPDVVFGKANVIQRGSKATVIAVSVMLDEVMEVCKDKDVTVLYYTTLEPFDHKTLADNCPANKILIVEPEYEGTLLYDVQRALPGHALQIEQVAFPREIFRNYGSYDEKMEHYGLTAERILQILDTIH